MTHIKLYACDGREAGIRGDDDEPSWLWEGTGGSGRAGSDR